MSNNINKLRHGRVVLHASIQIERARAICLVVCATSFYIEAPSCEVHPSSSSSSRRHESPAATHNIPQAQPIIVVLDVYLEDPSSTSLYVDHVARHIWYEDVK